MIVHDRYKDSWQQKLGFNLPQIEKGDRPLVWIHSISVGETRAVRALAQKIKRRKDNPILLVTTVTETGQAEAKRAIPEADAHAYLPLDFAVKKLVRQIKPDLLIMVESDFWYNFLKTAKECGAQTALVNGKISEASKVRFARLPRFSKRLFNLVDTYLVQAPVYQKRFEELGVSSEKIFVTGNMKFDDEPAPHGDLSAFRQSFGLTPTDEVLVLGSTHAPEEEQLLKALDPLFDRYPKLKVLLVPRHPQRFDDVEKLIERPYWRYSSGKPDPDARIVLVDAMGVLRGCYQLAMLAIVAGSYTEAVGGHNVIEPSWFGVPVIFGPHMHGQPELKELVLESRAGVQADIKDIAQVVERYLNSPADRQILGENGLRMVGELRGATEKTYKRLPKI